MKQTSVDTKHYAVWYEQRRHGTLLVHTQQTMGREGLQSFHPPEYFGFVSVVSSPCSYLFTSASVKIPFHAAPKCDTLNLTDM